MPVSCSVPLLSDMTPRKSLISENQYITLQEGIPYLVSVTSNGHSLENPWSPKREPCTTQPYLNRLNIDIVFKYLKC